MFGTGDFHQAVTVTANSGFVRAAFSQVMIGDVVKFVYIRSENRPFQKILGPTNKISKGK